MKSNPEEEGIVGTIQVTGLAQQAALLAAKAHGKSQSTTLKGPYIAHPMRVALYVSLWFGCQDDEVVAAALLHDVVEKTPVKLRDIREQFGPRVTAWVDLLTRPDDMAKETYYRRFEDAAWQARLIKIGDVLDHLDCDRDELPARLKSAERTVALVGTDEPPIIAARGWLETAITRARHRLAEEAAV